MSWSGDGSQIAVAEKSSSSTRGSSVTTNVDVSDGDDVGLGAGEGDGATVADGHGEWNGSVGADRSGETDGAGEQAAARTTTIAPTAERRNAPDVEVEGPGRDPVIIVS